MGKVYIRISREGIDGQKMEECGKIFYLRKQRSAYVKEKKEQKRNVSYVRMKKKYHGIIFSYRKAV